MFKRLSLLAAIVALTSMAFAAQAPAASAEDPARPGTVLAGRGVLDAQGDGLVAVRGRMDLTVSADAGILLVKDVDNDAVVRVEGHGETISWNGFTVYFGFDGDAHITAQDAGVIVIGRNVDLHVVGRGWAFLKGDGTYTVRPRMSVGASPRMSVGASNHGPFRWTQDGAFAGIGEEPAP